MTRVVVSARSYVFECGLPSFVCRVVFRVVVVVAVVVVIVVFVVEVKLMFVVV